MDDPMDMTSSEDDLDIAKAVRKDLGRDEYIQSEVTHVSELVPTKS